VLAVGAADVQENRITTVADHIAAASSTDAALKDTNALIRARSLSSVCQ
jgi:hypothetical protein